MYSVKNNLLFVDLHDSSTQNNGHSSIIDLIQSNRQSQVETVYNIESAQKKLKNLNHDVNILIIWLDKSSVLAWKDILRQIHDDVKVIVIFGFEDGVQRHVHEVMRSGAYAFAYPFNKSVLNEYIAALALESKMSATISNLRSQLASTKDLRKQINILLNELKSNPLIGYNRASISLIDRDGSRYLLKHDSTTNSPDRHLLLNTHKDKLIQEVIKKGVLILDIASMREDATLLASVGWEDSAATKDINSWIGIALKSYNRDMAIITLDRQEKGIYNRFGENITQFLESFRFIAGEMMESLMLARNKEALDDIIAHIGSDLHSEDLVTNILIKLKDILKCDNCTFFRKSLSYEGDSAVISKWVSANDPDKNNLHNKKVRLFKSGEGLAGYVLASNKSTIVPHALENHDFRPTPRLSGADLSMLVIPVHSNDSNRSQVIGVISCYKTEHPDFFTIYDRDLVEQVALYTASTLERTMVLEYSNEISKEINNLNNALEGNNRFPLLRKICKYALDVTGANEAVLHRLEFVNEENEKPIYRVTGESYHFPEEMKPTSPRLDGKSVTNAIIDAGSVVQFSEEAGNFDHVSVELKRHGIKHLTGIPLVVKDKGKDKIIGILYLNKYTEGRLSEIEVFSLELFARQAANAINNQEFLRERQTWTDAHTGLAGAIEAVTKSFDQTQIELTLREIILQASKLSGASFGYLAFIGKDRFEFRTAWPETILAELVSKGHILNPEKGVVGLSIRQKDIVLIQDIEEERRKNSDVWQAYIEFRSETRSELAVPICSEPSGNVIGVINLEHTEPYAFTDVHSRIMKLFARQVAIAFQKADLFKTIQHQLNIMRNLQGSMQEIAISSSNEMLHRAVNLTAQVLDASLVMFIPIIHDEHKNPVINVGGIVYNPNHYRINRDNIAKNDSIAIETFQQKQVHYYLDVQSKKQASSQISQHPLLGNHNGTALCIPLKKQQDCIGVMWILLDSNHPNKTLSGEDTEIFCVYANQIALIYANAAQSDDLSKKLRDTQNKIANHIEKDYTDTRNQSRVYYFLSLIGTFSGFVLFICIAALLFSGVAYNEPKTIISTTSAVLIEIISIFVFARANAAHDRMDKYHRELFHVRQFEILLLASEQLETQNQTKQTLIEAAAKSWLSSNPGW